MNKVFVDKARLLRRVIVISWITLALCFLVKIFGGNFFEIMCNNPNYKALCEYAENHLWLDLILSISSSMFCEVLYILAIVQKYKLSLKEFIVVFVSVCLSCIIKIINSSLGFICDIWITFLLPILLLGKNYKKYIDVFFAVILSFGFQFLSVIAKNIGIKVVDDSIFITLIFMIDVYIMFVLYYLYRNYKKEQEIMGRFWAFFAGKPDNILKRMLEGHKKKIDKNNAENAKLREEMIAIEEELLKRKNEK